MASIPSWAIAAWAGMPMTLMFSHMTPSWQVITPPTGSGMIAASAVYPSTRQASAPLPVHSSSTTDCRKTGAAGSYPECFSAKKAMV
ncbi:hypothetical protein D3C78_1846260 [compost metagenome]